MSNIMYKGKRYGSTAIESIPIGAVTAYTAYNLPPGWMLCDGSEVNRNTYSELFDIIGETFGAGDGSTTFNLPDYRGRTLVGLDGTQLEFNTLDSKGGGKTHTLSVAEMPSHRHNIRAADTYILSTSNVEATGYGLVSGGGFSDRAVIRQNLTSGGNITNSYTGAGEPHNNLQPYSTVNWIIKAKHLATSNVQDPDSYVLIDAVDRVTRLGLTRETGTVTPQPDKTIIQVTDFDLAQYVQDAIDNLPPFTHVGQVIESTTLTTPEQVAAVYGGEWEELGIVSDRIRLAELPDLTWHNWYACHLGTFPDGYVAKNVRNDANALVDAGVADTAWGTLGYGVPNGSYRIIMTCKTSGLYHITARPTNVNSGAALAVSSVNSQISIFPPGASPTDFQMVNSYAIATASFPSTTVGAMTRTQVYCNAGEVIGVRVNPVVSMESYYSIQLVEWNENPRHQYRRVA